MFAPPLIVSSSSLPWECDLSLHFLLLLEISFPNSFFSSLDDGIHIFIWQWYSLTMAHHRRPVAKPHRGHFVSHLKILACCVFSRVLRAGKIVDKSLARGGEPQRHYCAPSCYHITPGTDFPCTFQPFWSFGPLRHVCFSSESPTTKLWFGYCRHKFLFSLPFFSSFRPIVGQVRSGRENQ